MSQEDADRFVDNPNRKIFSATKAKAELIGDSVLLTFFLEAEDRLDAKIIRLFPGAIPDFLSEIQSVQNRLQGS